jgi:hypothetical protein
MGKKSEAAPLLTVRTAVVFLGGLVSAVIAGMVGYAANRDIQAAGVAGVVAFGAVSAWLHKHIGV